MSAAWYVAFVNGSTLHWRGSCFALEEDIREIGIETYAPVERRFVIQRRRKHEIIRPVLGPYVFCRFNREQDNWMPLLNIPGIHDILHSSEDLPQSVPDVQVAQLQRAEKAGLFNYTTAKSPFNIGDSVQICDGVWSGLMAKVQSASPRKRIKILLAGLGIASVDACILQKVSV